MGRKKEKIGQLALVLQEEVSSLNRLEMMRFRRLLDQRGALFIRTVAMEARGELPERPVVDYLFHPGENADDGSN